MCVERVRACAAQARAALAVCGRAGAVRTARQHLVLHKAVEAVEQEYDEDGELVLRRLGVALLGARVRDDGADAARPRLRFAGLGARWVRYWMWRTFTSNCILLLSSTML